MTTLATPILALLEQILLIEWAQSIGSRQPLRPPVVLWRFKEPSPDLEDRIRNAVVSYRGAVPWAAWKPRRNWVIAPRDVLDFGGIDATSSVLARFAKRFPERVESALADVPAMAVYLRGELLDPL